MGKALPSWFYKDPYQILDGYRKLIGKGREMRRKEKARNRAFNRRRIKALLRQEIKAGRVPEFIRRHYLNEDS